jgi:hypothetical protein
VRAGIDVGVEKGVTDGTAVSVPATIVSILLASVATLGSVPLLAQAGNKLNNTNVDIKSENFFMHVPPNLIWFFVVSQLLSQRSTSSKFYRQGRPVADKATRRRIRRLPRCSRRAGPLP